MNFEVIHKEDIFEPGKFFPQCHASTLIVLDDEEILAAWFAGTYEKHPDVAIWISKRKKDGQWTMPVKVADKENIPCWNPVLFKEDNRIYLFYKVGEEISEWRTMLMISDDNGTTWTEPNELVEGDKGGRGPVKNKMIILRDGIWLAPASTETDEYWDAFTDRSCDKGNTWEKSPVVPVDHTKLEGLGLIQPTLWESEKEKVHMLLRSTEGNIFRSDSTDNGNNWCEAYAIDLPNNNSGLDLVKLEDGTLVLVYNPIKGNWAARTPIVCCASTDNGYTWNEDFVLDHNENPLDKDDGEFSYPAIVAKEDEVYITYTWKRRGIAYWHLKLVRT